MVTDGSFVATSALFALTACGTAQLSDTSAASGASSSTHSTNVALPTSLGGDRAAVTEAVNQEYSAAEIGKVGEAQGQSDMVRQYASSVVQQHSGLEQQLQRLVQRRGGSVPTTLSEAGERELSGLGGESGPYFDREYLARQVELQNVAMRQLATMANSATDPEFRTWASGAWGTWQREEQWARRIHESLLEGTVLDAHSDIP